MKVRFNLSGSIKLLLAASLLWAALHLVGWDNFLSVAALLDAKALALCVIVLLFEHPLLGYRWYLLVSSVAPLPYIQHFRHYLIGVFLNVVSPASLGSDVYRFLALKDTTDRKARLASLLLRERLIGLISFLSFFIICYSLTLSFDASAFGSGLIEYSIICALCSLALACMPLASRFIQALLRFRCFGKLSFSSELEHLAREVMSLSPSWYNTRLLLLSYLGGCLIWTVAIKLIAVDLNIQLSFLVLGMIAVAVDLIRLVPVSVQGVGVREGAFAYFVSLAGATPEQGFALGLISYLAVTLSMILCGLLGFGLGLLEGRRSPEGTLPL